MPKFRILRAKNHSPPPEISVVGNGFCSVNYDLFKYSPSIWKCKPKLNATISIPHSTLSAVQVNDVFRNGKAETGTTSRSCLIRPIESIPFYSFCLRTQKAGRRHSYSVCLKKSGRPNHACQPLFTFFYISMKHYSYFANMKMHFQIFSFTCPN